MRKSSGRLSLGALARSCRSSRASIFARSGATALFQSTLSIAMGASTLSVGRGSGAALDPKRSGSSHFCSVVHNRRERVQIGRRYSQWKTRPSGWAFVSGGWRSFRLWLSALSLLAGRPYNPPMQRTKGWTVLLRADVRAILHHVQPSASPWPLIGNLLCSSTAALEYD